MWPTRYSKQRRAFITDDDDELNKEKKAVRQDRCVAPWDSSGASAAATELYGRMVGDNRHPEEEIEGRDGGPWDYAVTDDDSELDDKEEETAPDDASATGHTYDDMADSAPPHLRCVVLPLSSHHPSSGAPPRHYRFCCRRRPGVDAGLGRALGEAVTRLFGA